MSGEECRVSRTVDKAAQQTRLSRAVWEVLAGQGLERLTVRAVAAAAGCSTGLVMHRFPDRRALLLHARQLLHERVRTRVDALEAEAGNPRAALRAVLHQNLALDRESREKSVIWVGFLAAAVGNAEMTAAHRANNAAWRERLTRLVTAAAPDWPLDRVSIAALSLMALVEGAAALAVADPQAYAPDTQIAMLDTTLAAFGLNRTS